MERLWESWIWCLLLLAMVVKVSVVLRRLEEPVVREKEAQRADVESVDVRRRKQCRQARW